MNPLQHIAAEFQKKGGPLPFSRFMELALYHPERGYYRKPRSPIGKAGDYFTSVSAGPLFGKILSRQFLKYRELLGNPPDFEVVEFGGHRGQLKADVLASAPELKYRVVEAGDAIPERLTGCVFSNEFLDALPVHRVLVKNGTWREIFVGLGGDKELIETDAPLSDPRIGEVLKGLPVNLMEGYRTEVNLKASEWMGEIGRRLKRGYVVTVDYGFEREEYFSPRHHEGHLQCYHEHRRHHDPYVNIGEQDITAHVEWTSLIEAGEKAGLKTVALTDQSHFLLEAGREAIEEIVNRTAGALSSERAAVHQLIHPEMMGRAFKVLIQAKNA